jgi:iron(III) transport system permease protein
MSSAAARLVFLITLAFFACFFVVPIWGSVKMAFTDAKGGFTFDYIFEVFANPLYRQGLINSFSMAVWTTLGCILVSLPLAFLYVRFEFPGRALLNSLVLTPMILPPFVGAIGIKAMLGQAGAVNSFLINLGLMDPMHPNDWLGHGQMFGIVIMNVLHLYPVLYLNVSAALANLDPALEEAAANLGCPPGERFRRITLPLIMPGIFAGGTITFIWAFTELGVPLVFDYDRVTSVQIFHSLKDLSGNPFPYALVVVLLVFSTLIYAASKLLFERNMNGGGGGRATTARAAQILSAPIAWACTGFFVLITLLAIIPHIGVVLLSVAEDWYATVIPQSMTLSHYHDVLGHDLTISSISNSLKYASLATLLDLVLGIAVAYVVVRTKIKGRQILDAMAMLPLAVPGLVMAFGYLAMSREGQPFHGLMLGENPLIILVIAYAVRRLPYVVRSASAGLQQVSPTLEEAAQNLGAPPARALWRVTLPLVAPNLIAGGLLAFSFAMLEVSDSMILAQQAAHYPITKAIYSLVAALGNGPNLAAALGVWAMCFLAVTILGASLILGKKLGALFRA